MNGKNTDGRTQPQTLHAGGKMMAKMMGKCHENHPPSCRDDDERNKCGKDVDRDCEKCEDDDDRRCVDDEDRSPSHDDDDDDDDIDDDYDDERASLTSSIHRGGGGCTEEIPSGGMRSKRRKKGCYEGMMSCCRGGGGNGNGCGRRGGGGTASKTEEEKPTTEEEEILLYLIRRRLQRRALCMFAAAVLVGSAAAFVYGFVDVSVLTKNGGGGPGGHGSATASDDSELEGEKFRISLETDAEFVEWSKGVFNMTIGLNDYKGGVVDEPNVDWSLGHPTTREGRFPTVAQRVRYYMGKFYDNNDNDFPVDMFGTAFFRDTYSLLRTTRSFGVHSSSSSLVVLNLFTRSNFLDCYENKRENRTTEEVRYDPYCQDYVGLAILHNDMTAGAIVRRRHMADGTETVGPTGGAATGASSGGVGGYPVFGDTRSCRSPPPPPLPLSRKENLPDYNLGGGEEVRNSNNDDCDDGIGTILWPVNSRRRRHYAPAAKVSEVDVPWEDKLPLAIWRGGGGGTIDGGDDVFDEEAVAAANGDMKHSLVARHVNSTLVDAKFVDTMSTRIDGDDDDDATGEAGVPKEFLTSGADGDTELLRLRHKYLISVEGCDDDVSGNLEWMLFSNSVVLLSPTTVSESWTMEGLLEPYVHYLPVKEDMSDVESQIRWAESNPRDARRMAERSTLFVYDLLYHPDSVDDELSVQRGIVERYETNFGYATLRITQDSGHPLIGHVRWDTHPAERADRFPSVEERVRYYMGMWYERRRVVDMSRKVGQVVHVARLPPAVSAAGLDVDPKLGTPFVASGEALTDCAASAANATNAGVSGGVGGVGGKGVGDGHGSFGGYAGLRSGKERQKRRRLLLLARYCADALPFFDERLIYAAAIGTDDEGGQQQQRERGNLIDDTAKVLHFGEGAPPEGGNDGTAKAGFPIFAGTRRAAEPGSAAMTAAGGGAGGVKGKKKKGGGVGGSGGSNGGGESTVLWPFGMTTGGGGRDWGGRSNMGWDVVRSGLIEQLDVPFEEKKSLGIWRGGFGTKEEGRPRSDSVEYNNRQNLVGRSSEGWVDAEFVVPQQPPRDNGEEGSSDRRDMMEEVLGYRYIVATEDEYRPNADLKWMLLSQSVVLMPLTPKYTSWFMEDLLEPYVHFVPIDDDYANVETQIAWCETHPADARRISERATLFVYDMLFHRRSLEEDREVRVRLLEMYGEQFGGG